MVELMELAKQLLQKLSNYYKNMSFKTMLVGADTYSQNINQLRLWSEKLNVKFISNEFTMTPSIVYDALNSGIKIMTK